MFKKVSFTFLILFAGLFSTLFTTDQYGQDDYLTIATKVEPPRIKQGNEGVLKIKITPRAGIRISFRPEFMINLVKNNNLTFSKLFFKASELDFSTKQENGRVLLELDKEVEIPFKVNDEALIGRQRIMGEVVFTVVFKDNWSLKTRQKFSVDFVSRRNRNLKKKK